MYSLLALNKFLGPAVCGSALHVSMGRGESIYTMGISNAADQGSLLRELGYQHTTREASYACGNF